MAQTVGDIAQYQYSQTGDEKWGEGGAYRTLMHTVGAALVVQLGNGEGLNAAMGALASQLTTNQLAEFGRDLAIATVGTDNPEVGLFLANLVTNLASGAVGYAAGGETGHTSSATIDRYNRELTNAEKEFIKALEISDAEKERLTYVAEILVRAGYNEPSVVYGWNFNQDVDLDQYQIEIDLLNSAGYYYPPGLLEVRQKTGVAVPYNPMRLFYYSPADAARDNALWLESEYRTTPRTIGVFQTAAGSTILVGSSLFAGVTSETGVGLAFGLAGMAYGADLANSGGYLVRTGQYSDTYFVSGLKSTGMPDSLVFGIDMGTGLAFGGISGSALKPASGTYKTTTATVINKAGGKIDNTSPSTPVGSKGNILTVPDGANSPAKIGSIDYSGHALDRMQRQGITPTAVDHTIKTGNVVVGKNAGTTAYYSKANNITVITDTKTNRVITVDYGKIKQ